MIRNDYVVNTEPLYLGSNVKIDLLLNVDTATSALISIVNPAGVKVVTDESISKIANKTYRYIYESDKYIDMTDRSVEGIYQAEITLTSGTYKVVKLYNFEMIKTLST